MLVHTLHEYEVISLRRKKSKCNRTIQNAPQVSKMKRILCPDWLPELARSELLDLFPKEKSVFGVWSYNKSFNDQDCAVKMAALMLYLPTLKHPRMRESHACVQKKCSKVFGTSSDIFGNSQKSSEIVGKLRKSLGRFRKS